MLSAPLQPTPFQMPVRALLTLQIEHGLGGHSSTTKRVLDKLNAQMEGVLLISIRLTRTCLSLQTTTLLQQIMSTILSFTAAQTHGSDLLTIKTYGSCQELKQCQTLCFKLSRLKCRE